jgi:hypothetical protein
MTFPGVEGVVGPGWLSTTGFQVRQSRAGAYPGGETFSTVLDSMGPNAPAWGVTAAAVTVEQEAAADPHPIEQQNFELDFKQYNNPAGHGNADPGYTGE